MGAIYLLARYHPATHYGDTEWEPVQRHIAALDAKRQRVGPEGCVGNGTENAGNVAQHDDPLHVAAGEAEDSVIVLGPTPAFVRGDALVTVENSPPATVAAAPIGELRPRL